MSEYLDTAKDMALDVVADNNVEALRAAAEGQPAVAASHIGEACEAIIELSGIIHG